MKAIKLVSISFVLGLFTFILLTQLGETTVKGTQANVSTELSSHVFDTSEITIDNIQYTALLNSEGIQIIDTTGFLIKKIDYPESVVSIIESNHIRDAISETGILNKDIIDLKLKTIEDIDNKGFSDFLIIIRSRRVKEFNKLVTINYESSNVIWEYNPTIQSSKLCRFSTYCEEPVDLIQVELRDEDIYVISGYKMEQINLKTGDTKKQFHYKNNIWRFEFISDVNKDGIDDLALAVQPTNIIFIDGNTFNQLKELKVAKDLKLTKLKTIKLNVRELEFLPKQNRLLAASEDGNVYEIDVHENKIINKIQLFSTEQLIPHYSDLKYSNKRSNLESYRVGDIEYFLSGINAPVTFELENISSIDKDRLDDYIVEWKMSDQNLTSSKKMGQFRIQKTNAEPVVFEQADFQFKKGDFIVYRGFGHLNLWDLEENRHILVSEYKIHPGTVLKSHTNGMIMIDPKPKVTQLSVDFLPSLQPNWLIDSKEIKQEELLVSDEYFVKVEQRLIYNDIISYFALYNKEFELIKTHQTESGTYFLHKYLSDDNFFIVEANDYNQILTTKRYNNSTGDLVDERTFDYNNYNNHQSSEPKNDLEFDAISYHDVNNDHVNELLIVVTYNDGFDTGNRQSHYLIYDLVNANVLVDNSSDVKIANHYKIHDDVNNDGYKELLTHELKSYFFYDRTVLDFNLHKTSEGDLFNEENTLFKSIDIPYGNYEFIKEVDLNNDGYDEFIMNFSDFVYTHKKALYIFDYKNENLVKVGDFNNNDYRIEDLDEDGTIDIITIEPKSLVSSELAIHNYSNGGVITPYTYTIDGFYSETPTEQYTIYDYNKDGVKDLIFSTYDEHHNIGLDIIDFKLKQNIKTKTYNIYSHQSTEEMGENLTYSKIQLSLLNDLPYFIVETPAASFETSEFSYTIKKRIHPIEKQFLLFGPDTLDLEYVYGEEQNKTDRIFYKASDGSMLMKNPINYHNIKSELTGLYDTNYHFKLNQEIDVDRVLVIINDETLKSNSIIEFDQGDFNINLSNGDYNLTFYIYTEEGNCFLYHDTVTIKRENTDSIKYQVVILTIGTIMFAGSSIIIKKYIHK
ncbi:hypothetical protein [Haloplasma contractile]|uniref:Uncharacterized protein n=1 Tax=Haloplasma contractile SSD-17B TaxID=1033810 RepID=F7Q1C3_9MOLU|nr:hypothetical protein [Haloplasma contractile]ERJ12840.1 hypothetical protein HLPCO_001180 [Haloplasma contractile SSD-17B]